MALALLKQRLEAAASQVEVEGSQRVEVGYTPLQRQYLDHYRGVDWATWLVELFPTHFTDENKFHPFASFHKELWEWVHGITPDTRPDPLVAVWFRFGGKSTNAEATAIYLGAENIRRYGLYVCGTQAQADDHVQNVAAMLESKRIAARYPHMAERLMGKYNNSKGWRINRLRTATGFTLDAIGLDKAIRGAKLEDQRPDFIIFDDIDDQNDTPRTVLKKEDTIKRKILPAGANNLAILAVQNLIHSGSLFTRLINGEADYLRRRRVSGPFPALKDMTYKRDGDFEVITGGTPTWAAKGVKECQELVEDISLRAFLVECQHETQEAEGMFLAGIWHSSIHVIKPFTVPGGWRIDRSFDWGSSKPYACIWWAESDGETPAEIDGKERTFPRRTLFAIRELYGWNGKPNQGNRDDSTEQAKKIKAVEKDMPYEGILAGPADSSIYDVTDGDSIAKRMARAGVRWREAEKGPGSRKAGADKIATMLRAASSRPMEGPGLFTFDNCTNIARTFPILPKDPLKDGDVDTDAEDHLWDTARYRVLDPQHELQERHIF